MEAVLEGTELIQEVFQTCRAKAFGKFLVLERAGVADLSFGIPLFLCVYGMCKDETQCVRTKEV